MLLAFSVYHADTFLLEHFLQFVRSGSGSKINVSWLLPHHQVPTQNISELVKFNDNSCSQLPYSSTSHSNFMTVFCEHIPQDFQLGSKQGLKIGTFQLHGLQVSFE